MRPILGVHGVSVTSAYGDTWADVLSTRGLAALVQQAPWKSRGSIAADLRGLLLEKEFRERAIIDVADRILDFTRTYRDGVVLAHSAGQPIVFAALRYLASMGEEVHVDVVTAGGPMSHRIWKNLFRTVGIGAPPGRKPVHLWNPEDIVCCFRPLGRFGVVHPSWMDARYTPFSGRRGIAGEHNIIDYLDSVQAVHALTRK